MIRDAVDPQAIPIRLQRTLWEAADADDLLPPAEILRDGDRSIGAEDEGVEVAGGLAAAANDDGAAVEDGRDDVGVDLDPDSLPMPSGTLGIIGQRIRIHLVLIVDGEV